MSASVTPDLEPNSRSTAALSRVNEIRRVIDGSPTQLPLKEIWEAKPGWRGWLSTVDHKTIGLRYIITAFIFFVDGRGRSANHASQLARPNATLLTPEQYNQLFTMHGVTMIFLYALPVLSGFSNYLWPLVLGARDLAFPRLNALSYWIFLFAGVFLYSSFPFGQAPNAAWLPLSGLEYNTGPNIDIYALGMVLLGISTTVGSVKFVATVARMRAPGMSLNRVPVLVWGTLTASGGNLLAVPSVSLAFFMLWLDRQFGTHFFDVLSGGRPLLWQHMF